MPYIMTKKQQKEVLYVELPARLKQRLSKLAEKRSRKITAEATLAILRYVEQEEAAEGITDRGNDSAS